MGQAPATDLNTQPHKPQRGACSGVGELTQPPALLGTPNLQGNQLGKLSPVRRGGNGLRVWVVRTLFLASGAQGMRFMRSMRTTGPGLHFLEEGGCF